MESSDDIKVRKKRRKPGFRRHALPKYTKHDIRWSYASMFINVMNSKDVYDVYSFLTMFSTRYVKFFTVYHDAIALETGSISFVKHWYLHTLGSPDLVYQFTRPNVKISADGSSEIAFDISMVGNFLYSVPKMGIGEKDVNEIMTAPHVQLCSVQKKIGSLLLETDNEFGQLTPRSGSDESLLLKTLSAQSPLGSLKTPFKMYCKGMIVMRLASDGWINSLLCALTESVTEEIINYKEEETTLLQHVLVVSEEKNDISHL